MLFGLEELLKNNYDPLKVERAVIRFWENHRVYERVKQETWDKRVNAPIFAFLEGPPTTNGFMHVGHARGRTLKDVKLRFYRMKGYRVWDQAGWDTQGLPVELEVEKKLGFRSKRDIVVFGVERFVDECQRLVDHYLKHWEAASRRLGLWLDYAHAYQTRHPSYIDSLWSFLKEMWDRGLLYEDLYVVPRCPRCGTALSSHEVAQGYREVEDPSVYFKVELLGKPKTYLIAWTTTPWTIIANEALAVHPHEDYVVIEVDGERWVLAEKRLGSFIETTGTRSYRLSGRIKGKSLEGTRYRHPLRQLVDYHSKCRPPNHQVVCADWVSMEEGTGVVHVAPAHGPEDFELAKDAGLNVYTPLQEDGFFSRDAGVYSGLWFIDANAKVIEDLGSLGLLVYAGKTRHSYPYCWRCGTPLIYYASRQWFLRVTKVKDEMLEAIEREILWRPGWALERMADWVENARDWCISRERFWGTPLPIWTCRSCGFKLAVGSLAELKGKARNPSDVRGHHRPWIDHVILECPKCKGDMVREPFVVDVWMDSGVAHTASLAQYGWEDLKATLYPYTWITEAADQTRGWFYTLLVTAMLWHGTPPYRRVLLQGHVLDRHGRKMSKSRGNVVWALEWISRNGADPTRIFLLSRSPWDSINFDPAEVHRYKRYLNILWNSVKFAAMYMHVDGWVPEEPQADSLEYEDKWILYELHKTIRYVEEAIENDNIHQAVAALIEFIVEKLSRRYITVARPRVWTDEMTSSKRAAYSTLHYVLDRLIRMMAPFTPFITEYLYQAYIGGLGSADKVTVHVEDWPRVDPNLIDEKAWRAVEAMFDLADRILALRAEAGIKRRWPLKLVLVEPTGDIRARDLEASTGALSRYANVKEVRVGRSSARGGYRVVEEAGIRAYVRLDVDEDVMLEGLAREVVRRAQTMRRQMGLEVDRVLSSLEVYTKSELIRRAIMRHRDYIASEVRVKEVSLIEGSRPDLVRWNIDGEEVGLRLR